MLNKLHRLSRPGKRLTIPATSHVQIFNFRLNLLSNYANDNESLSSSGCISDKGRGYFSNVAEMEISLQHPFPVAVLCLLELPADSMHPPSAQK